MGTVGRFARRRLRRHAADHGHGGRVVLGAVAGFVVVWVVGAVALHFPGQSDLRRGAQSSLVLQRLNDLVPRGG